MKYIFTFAFIILYSRLCFAQENPPNYFMSYPYDAYEIMKSPSGWDAKDWLTAGAITTAGGVLILADESITSYFQRNQTEGLSNFSKYVAEPAGSGVITVPALLTLSTIGWATENHQHTYVGLQGVKAYLLAGGATMVLKFAFRRERPKEQEVLNPLKFQGPFTPGTDHLSFPSGHTSTAFAVATVLAKGYPESKWVGYVSYSLATLTGVSRIYDNYHWASDVFIGAALGYYIGKIIMDKPHWQITSGHVNGQSTMGVIMPL